MEKRFNELSLQLIDQINSEGFWEGKLSSSALGVSVAITALHFYDSQVFNTEISSGLNWLFNNINSDGSYGDTPDSPGNISTSLLVYAAIHNCSPHCFDKTLTLNKISNYLSLMSIDIKSDQFIDQILHYYKNDYTFSVPILTMCALCGIPDGNRFDSIPQLPFELALLPGKFYSALNLSVVSYAIPALIAVGIVIFKKKKTTLFLRWIREKSIMKSLILLENMTPKSGGFLEAIPLTAFVNLSLVNAGYGKLPIVKKGIEFLKKTQRADGSWPIDINLSNWVTTLSIKAFRSKLNNTLSEDERQKLTDYLKFCQNKTIHPFNGTGPGGWGWTKHTGSVPDADDTAGAILALFCLQPKDLIKKEVLAGTEWLVKLQNRDGGIPSFSRGWGKLPFDQSCTDLTGHGILAISAAIRNYRDEIPPKELKMITRAFEKAVFYLQKKQKNDGSWVPLWFGNQHTINNINPVYGTARVLTYLEDIQLHDWLRSDIRSVIQEMIDSSILFLLKVQNKDGSWGGGIGIPGTIEETALAVSALLPSGNKDSCSRAFIWLDDYYLKFGLKPSPIGLYFAALWYSEKMYPLVSYLEAITRNIETIDKP